MNKFDNFLLIIVVCLVEGLNTYLEQAYGLGLILGTLIIIMTKMKGGKNE